jgi:hypothetical protein
MLSDVFPHTLLREFFTQRIKDIRPEDIVRFGEDKPDIMIANAVILFFGASKDWARQLNAAIEMADCLSPEQKQRGHATVGNIEHQFGEEEVDGFISRILTAFDGMGAWESIGPADFKDAMRYLLVESKIFQGKVRRCPAGAVTMQLSGIVGKDSATPLHETFGATFYAFYEALRTMAYERKDREEQRHSAKAQASKTTGQCPYSGR